MTNLVLYVVTVLIWGTTWFAIEFQLGGVAIEVSLAYRYLLAAALALCAALSARPSAEAGFCFIAPPLASISKIEPADGNGSCCMFCPSFNSPNATA